MLRNLSAIAVLLLLISIASAEPCTSWERESSYNQKFNSETIETVKGTVSEVSTYSMPDCEECGIQLKLKSDGEPVTVHLGPDWYIRNQGRQFEVGDKVTIKGSRIDFNGSPALLALAVVMNNHMLVLRSASGAPVWAGWQSMR
jgi:hypothetical protein